METFWFFIQRVSSLLQSPDVCTSQLIAMVTWSSLCSGAGLQACMSLAFYLFWLCCGRLSRFLHGIRSRTPFCLGLTGAKRCSSTQNMVKFFFPAVHWTSAEACGDKNRGAAAAMAASCCLTGFCVAAVSRPESSSSSVHEAELNSQLQDPSDCFPRVCSEVLIGVFLEQIGFDEPFSVCLKADAPPQPFRWCWHQVLVLKFSAEDFLTPTVDGVRGRLHFQ